MANTGSWAGKILSRPVVGVGLPELFAFFDGSLEAYACCIYVRWLLAGDNKQAPAYQVRLLTGKARVMPLKGSTAPRSELSGLLILSRLLKVVVDALWEKPTSVTITGDSQCTIAALEKSGGLRDRQEPEGSFRDSGGG